MVYLKVSDGTETRKFQVNPSNVTFDQLKERLTSFFPTALSGQSDLSLQYRDNDGDIITLSSNQELQEALSQLPEEAVWKLHIKNNPHTHTHKTRRPTQQQQHRQRRCHDVSPFEPSWRPFGLFSNPWATFDRENSETLQLARILEDHFFQSSEKGEGKNDAAATTGVANSKAATNSENGATESGETKSSEEDPDEFIKSKLEEPTKKKTTEEKSDDTSHPHVRHWGVWEPRVFVSPFGFRTVVGPVGYSIRWGPQSHDGGCSGGVCGGKKEEKKDETVNSQAEKTSGTPTPEKTTESQASPKEPKSEATTASE